ncbi:MAG: hypothetical protein M0R47_21290 [Methylobacter sp.]|jgi:hypothetical protein|uniref:hypothetical protein n=1 Tax=Methylobacter sp. TaxID=2051955 RepID=UPI0025FEB431|nr:hypothetical protein [Methylobacter sp.]MCK9623058.1 hypothetical protein [Methylobacter sp.]
MFMRFAFIGATLGLIIPIVLLLKVQVTGEAFGVIEVLAWPSSFSLMANEAYQDGDPMIWFNMVVSIFINMVWYISLASIIFTFSRLVKGHSGP